MKQSSMLLIRKARPPPPDRLSDDLDGVKDGHGGIETEEYDGGVAKPNEVNG